MADNMFPPRFNVIKAGWNLNQRRATAVGDTVGIATAGYIEFIGDIAECPDPQCLIVSNEASSTFTFYKNYTTGAVVDADPAIISTGTGIWAMTGADRTFGGMYTKFAGMKNWRYVGAAARPDRLLYKHVGTNFYLQSVAADSAAAKAQRTPGGGPVLFPLIEAGATGYLFQAICCGLEAEDSVDSVYGLPTWGNVLGRVADRTSNLGGVYHDLADYPVRKPVPVSVGQKQTALRTLHAGATFASGDARLAVYSCSQTSTRLVRILPPLATTVAVDYNFATNQDWIMSNPGERLVIEVNEIEQASVKSNGIANGVSAPANTITLEAMYGVGIPN